MKDNYRYCFLLLFVLALVVNFSGINVRFFTDDPGLYASISKNLLYHRNFFDLFTYNHDWLDKPHFPFWMGLLSFKIFGVSSWAYRLPALLFFLLSLLYTYLFSKKYYGTEIGWIAVLILATSQHVVMLNTDVRAEPYLMALVIGSIYHISRLHERFSIADLLLAALLTACAIMTKGIFVIVAIYGAVFGQMLFQRKLKEVFRLKWLFLGLFTLIFTLPELYALYTQFDLHPEKTVFNRHQVSGIKWFLWDSQFGRFVNQGPIQHGRSGDPIFYLHTLLWAFAPWCLLFYYAVYKNIRGLWQKIKLPEYYAISGGLLLLLLFSLSRFQLPFYTNTVFPLFAVITAPVCYQQLSRFGTSYRLAGLWLYIVLLIPIILAVNYFSKPGNQGWFIVDCLGFGLTVIIIAVGVKKPNLKAFFIACAVILFANFYLNTVFYPVVASYNGQVKAADYLNKDTADLHIYTVKFENNIFQFYSKRQVDFIPLDSFNNFKPLPHAVFYINHKSMEVLRQNHADFKVIKAFENYPQEIIYPKFIDKNTRHTMLDSIYLVTK